MADQIKRMRYFNGLFLKQEEFNLEQDYHTRLRRLHNRHFHGAGVVWGLEVTDGPTPTEIQIAPGMALDWFFDSEYGEDSSHEIILTQARDIDLSAYNPGDKVYVWIKYLETPADVVPDRGGTSEIHFLEQPVIEHGTVRPMDENLDLILALVTVQPDGSVHGNVEDPTPGAIDMGATVPDSGDPPLSLRKMSGYAAPRIETDRLELNLSEEGDPEERASISAEFDAVEGEIQTTVTTDRAIFSKDVQINGELRFNGETDTANSITSDVQLASGAPNTLPTADAVKGYVDAAILGLNDLGGPVNYVVNANAESGAGFGAPASNGVTVNRHSGANVIGGDFSFEYAFDGSHTLSSYGYLDVSKPSAIDAGSFVYLKFDFRSGTGYLPGDLIIKYYDGAQETDVFLQETIPAGLSRVVAYVDIPATAQAGQLRFYAGTDDHAFTVYVDSVFLGPSEAPIGPAIGPWIDAGPMTITATGTNPTKGGNIEHDQVRYRRVGDSAEIEYFYYQGTGGVAGSGGYHFHLPAGLKADLTQLDSSGNVYSMTGYGFVGTATSTTVVTAFLAAATDDRVQLYSTENDNNIANNFYSLSEPGLRYSMRLTVPIAGWESTARLIAGGPKVGYFYNTDASGSDDTTSFAEGREGGLVPNISNSTPSTVNKRIELDRPYEHVKFQLQIGGTGSWNSFPLRIGTWQDSIGNTILEGVSLTRIADTLYVVTFGSGGVDAVLNGWDDQHAAGTRWRVVAYDGGPEVFELPDAAGGGSGSGEKNYVRNPDAERGTANVRTSSGNVASGLASENDVLSGGASHEITFNGSHTTSDYVAFELTRIDRLDRGTRMRLRFDFDAATGYQAGDLRVVFYDGASEIDVPLREEIPAALSQIHAYVDVPASAADDCELRLYAATDDHAFTFRADNLIFGPTRVPAGTAVGPWIDAGAITVTSGTGNPADAPDKGTPLVDQVQYRRVGDSAEIRYIFEQDVAGTSGSGEYRYALPAGLEIDVSRFGPDFSDGYRAPGYGALATNGNFGVATPIMRTSTEFAILLPEDSQIHSSTISSFADAGLRFSFTAIVPIVGWESTARLISAEPRTGYFYNSDTSGSSDSTSFAEGKGGGLVPNMTQENNNAGIEKRIQLTRPYQNVEVQLQINGEGPWIKAYPYVRARPDGISDPNFAVWGVITRTYSSTEIAVIFGHRGTTTYLDTSWGAEHAAGTRWRVVAWDDAPQAFEVPTSRRMVQIKETQPSGTDAGSSVIGYNVRQFNTLEDPRSHGVVSVGASGVFTCQPGTGVMEFMAPALQPTQHRLRLVDADTSAVLATGRSHYNSPTIFYQDHATLTYNFQFSTVRNLRLEHYFTSDKSADGLGVAVNDGDVEVYATGEITYD